MIQLSKTRYIHLRRCGVGLARNYYQEMKAVVWRSGTRGVPFSGWIHLNISSLRSYKDIVDLNGILQIGVTSAGICPVRSPFYYYH